ncbi:ATP-dependent RNA-DNA and DNA-DNA helicase protein [Rhizobium phage RHph_X2_26]|nr:ATP-dependent RNA-DNA and DNA-DNA helicase protein [Rhizobium phage RHph_X2_26]
MSDIYGGFDPRYYQSGAVDALFKYWDEHEGSPLIDLAMGAGKSPVMAMIAIRLVKGWPGLRVGIVTHVKELIVQNYKELIGMWRGAPAGIYSSSVGRKDRGAQILFGGIQTIWNKVQIIGHLDVILIDECHLIPDEDATQYNQFFKAMRELNPDLKIVGLTATPYRLKSGRLDEGDDRMFDRIIYTYSVADGVRDGYLTPLSSKETEIEVDMGSTSRRKSEYTRKELEAKFNVDEVTQKAVAEIVRRGEASNRRSWMMFCSGVEHALAVRDEIRRYGVTCEAIDGSTPSGERDRIIEAFKNYEIRALTNNSVLTTGFNHKGVDLIAFLRSTMSASLYMQMAGRGTRVLYAPGMPLDTPEERRAAIAAGPKPNCLVLDFARLVNTHGPVDDVRVKGSEGSGDGEAPCKVCPTDRKDKNGKQGCGEKVHAAAFECKECGYQFEINTAPKIDEKAADVPIMASTPPEWRHVWSRSFAHNAGKGGKPDTLKITYKVAGGGFIMQWLSPEAPQAWMRAAFRTFWTAHGGATPCPVDALEAIERQGELVRTYRILVKPREKFWDVKDYDPWIDAAKAPLGTVSPTIPF